MADWEVFRERFKYRRVYKTAPKTLVFGASDTVKSLSFNGNCFLNMLKIIIPNWADPVTLTLTITDSDGDVIYTSEALAANTNNIISGLLETIPLWGECTFTFTLSAVPNSTDDVVATAYCT